MAFNSEQYLKANQDVADWWTDGSQAGIHSGSDGAYNKHFGKGNSRYVSKSTAGWEQTWVGDMNKRYGTNYSDMGQFSRDQYAKHHYGRYGLQEGRTWQDPTPPPQPPQAKPQPKPQPAPKPIPAPSKPQQFVKPAPQEAPNSSSSRRYAGGRDFRESLNKTNYGKSFEQQANREIDYQNTSTAKSSQASSDIFNKYANANRSAQFGRSDGSSIADKYIFKAKENNPIDVVALDKHIRRGPLYHEAKSEIAGLLTYGDKYRNSRENLGSWNQPNPMEGIESPDFESIYDRTRNDINDIKI